MLTPLGLRKTLRAFARKRDGAAAIEFGFLFPVVIALVCGVIYLALFFFRISQAEAAVRSAQDKVIMLENATEAQIAAIFMEEVDDLKYSTEESEATIIEREDGLRLARFKIETKFAGETPFLNIDGFKHVTEVQIPLLDR